MADRGNFVYIEEKNHVCIIDRTNDKRYHLYDSDAYRFKKNQAHLHLEYGGGNQLLLTDNRTGESFYTENRRSESGGGGGGAGGGLFAGMLLVGLAGIHDVTYVGALAPALIADMAVSFPVGTLIALAMLAGMMYAVKACRSQRNQDSDLFMSTMLVLLGALVFGIISLFVLRYGFKSRGLMFVGVETFFSFHAIGVAFDVLTSILVVFLLWAMLFLLFLAASAVLQLSLRMLLKSLAMYLIVFSAMLLLYPLMSDILGNELQLSLGGIGYTARDFINMLTSEIKFTLKAQTWLNEYIFSKSAKVIRQYALYGLGGGVVLYMAGVGVGRLQEYTRKRRFEKQKPKELAKA